MAEKNIFDDKNFGADSEMSSMSVDWKTPGDFILGTFIKARHEVETQFGLNSIYEFLAENGKSGDTVINKGETWTVWGRNDMFNGQMNSLRPGQVVKISFVESKPSKKGNPAKIIKIFAPKDNTGKPVMNQEYLDTQGVTGVDM